MGVRITYYGKKGTIYSEIDELENFGIHTGVWVIPFPGDSPAMGLVERLIQSDYCPPIFHSEVIYKVKVEMLEQ